MKKHLLDYYLSELEKIVLENNEKKYRAKQLFEGLYLGKKLEDISNLPKSLIETLQKEYSSYPITEIKRQESSDGTIKFLFLLQDNRAIESVLMKYEHGYSVCVSSQVGCRMGCEFCASGILGLNRNLTPGEILAQVLYINAFIGGKLGSNKKVNHVVLMGTGEPLDNYDNVIKFLKLVNEEKGINISLRNISLSTCGLAPQIKALANERMPIVLTLSLHAGTDETRKSIMRIANKYSIKEVLDACEYYYSINKRRISLEYILIKDVTLTSDNKKSLIQLLKGKPFHLNLIMLNEVEGKLLKRPSIKEARDFEANLKKAGLNVTLRRTLGKDIDAACGQLRQKHLKEKGEN